MDTSVIVAFIGVIGTLSGLLLGWKGAARTAKQDVVQEVKDDASMKSDVEYIKRGVDDLRLDMREQSRKYDAKFDDLTERMTRAEESGKQAHKRLDRLEGAH